MTKQTEQQPNGSTLLIVKDLFGPLNSTEQIVDILPFKLLAQEIQDYAIIGIDMSGAVISWNLGAEKIKGYHEKEILGRHFSIFYPENDVAGGLPAELLNEAKAKGRVVHEGWRIRKDGSRFWGLVVITKVTAPSSGWQGFIKITRDLTEKKLADSLLIASENHFRTLFNAAFQYVILLDRDGAIIEANQTALNFANTDMASLVGKSFSDGHWTRFSPKMREKFRKAIAVGESVKETRFEVEIVNSLHQKAVVDFWIKALPDQSGQAKTIVIEGRDITEIKNLQLQLVQTRERQNKILRLSALHLHERERSKISHELNENINQILAACRLLLDQSDVTSSEEAAGSIASISSHLKNAIEQNNKLSKTLNPLILMEMGLAAAVRDLIRNLQTDDGPDIHMNFVKDFEDLLIFDRKIAMFRIIQEQLSNAILHAGASLVNLKLSVSMNEIIYVYTDDGVGFNKPKNEWGLGLQSIQNHVDLMDGSLKLSSTRGVGCMMVIRIPIQK